MTTGAQERGRAMAGSTPLVSIILPVHDGERWLEEAITSVLTQTFTDLELIAVDDGSTDESGAILADAQRRDPRVRIVTRPNGGIATAMNSGIDAARGRYLARLDADDVCHPTRIARQVEHLRANPDVAAVGTAIRVIDADGRELRTVVNPSRAEGLAEAFELHDLIANPSVVMDADAVRAVGGHRAAFEPADDYDLFLRLLDAGYALDNLPEVLVDYRWHGGNVSVTAERRQRERAFDAILSHRLRVAGLPDGIGEDGERTHRTMLDAVPEAVLAAADPHLLHLLVLHLSEDAALSRGGLADAGRGVARIERALRGHPLFVRPALRLLAADLAAVRPGAAGRDLAIAARGTATALRREWRRRLARLPLRATS
jgi:hypothetical protein